LAYATEVYKRQISCCEHAQTIAMPRSSMAVELGSPEPPSRHPGVARDTLKDTHGANVNFNIKQHGTWNMSYRHIRIPHSPFTKHQARQAPKQTNIHPTSIHEPRH
jgi:hypothetical protein